MRRNLLIKPTTATFAIVGAILLAQTTFIQQTETILTPRTYFGSFQNDENISQSLSAYISTVQNPFRTPIEIELSSDLVNWSSYTIQYGRPLELNCQESNYIRIISRSSNETQAQQKVAVYRLGCQARYSIRWNQAEMQWEIITLRVEGS